MFNKLSNKSLTIVFIVLLIGVAAFVLYDSHHGERSFRSELVSIDTAKVTSIKIYPKSDSHKEVNLYKEGKYWKVKLPGNKTGDVTDNKIRQIFDQLLSIKPASVAAQSPDKWKEYKVDTAQATEVKVYQGSDNTLDLMIGKFAFQQPRSMSTFVRVGGDDNVYETNGMISYTFDHGPNYFRDDRVISDDYNDWSKLSFTYPGDSSFTLQKVDKKWAIDGRAADSSKVVDFLRPLSHLTNSEFVDNFDHNILNKASYTLTITSSSKGAITVTGFQKGDTLLVTSSENPDVYFNGMKNGFKKNLFAGKNKFLKK